jgi:hypothetical protein
MEGSSAVDSQQRPPPFRRNLLLSFSPKDAQHNLPVLFDTGSRLSCIDESLLPADVPRYYTKRQVFFGPSSQMVTSVVYAWIYLNHQARRIRLHVIKDMGYPREVIVGQDFMGSQEFAIEQDSSTYKQRLSSVSKLHKPKVGLQGSIRRTGSSEPYSYLRPLIEKNAAQSKVNKLPVHRSFDHHIPLKHNAIFPRRRPYPVAAKHQPALKNWISDQLKTGQIRPSESPIAAPVFLIPKKNGDVRPVIDSRDVNAITIVSQYPTANPDLAMRNPRIAEAKVFLQST